MIVRDRGDSWQIVLQTDHADLAAGFARAWGERSSRFESLVLATERHDDGWAVWEQAPLVDTETGKPVDFLDVGVPAHLAFYRACIAAVTEHDPYAGLLVSMHGAGIYRQRYGTDPALSLSRAAEVADQVEAFVAEQEELHTRLQELAGCTAEERWADYHRLQLYDRLSLYFCMRDAENGEPWEIGEYRITPRGPWQVTLDPYPFSTGQVRLPLVRRLVPKRDRPQQDFAAELRSIPEEHISIEIHDD